uniref:CCHC-type domain-containing protein n=1 Tax=Tanacetum cinerariifolium TaxID=118510 RepID=A0A6L2JLU2_TANCI|nr:hypothetical protein [Tanacetum cinerariifolium]
MIANPNAPDTPGIDGVRPTRPARVMETYVIVSKEKKKKIDGEVEDVLIILTGIDYDIYSTVDACYNAMQMWKAIERLRQCDINVQDLETNLFWEFGKFTSQDGETLYSYNSRTQVVQHTWIQCFKCKEFGLVAKECKKAKRELKARYMHMEKIQKVISDAADNSGPIFDTEPLEKVHNTDDNYNVFENERQHPEQPKFINDSHVMEKDDRNISPN